MIAVIETGVANVASIVNAFLRLGVRVTLTRDPELVRRAARVVLPGVGAFGTAATELRARGLDSAVRERIADGTPLLAVCLGMQLLCDGSEETPGVPGLGIVPGICQRLPAGLRVPHLGWTASSLIRARVSSTPRRPHSRIPMLCARRPPVGLRHGRRTESHSSLRWSVARHWPASSTPSCRAHTGRLYWHGG